MGYLKRGEVAKATNTNIETIRYYEKSGLIPEARRNDKGYRLFPEDTVQAVLFIKNCQELGFTLKEITQLQNLRIEENQQCSHIKVSVDAKITELDRKIASLKVMRKALVSMSSLCEPGVSGRSCHFLELIEEESS